MKNFILALLLLGVATTASAQQCEATAEVNAVRILGQGPNGELTTQEYPEVAGKNRFYQVLENGWVFALLPAENGWNIRLYENEIIGNARDLTSMTPPFYSVPNPREVFGWHFRNAANTATNTGDVNAPQHLRVFVISPAIAGTGGFRPPVETSTAPAQTPNPDDGIGWLNVLDYGLTGLEPGQKARMNYLKFDACLSWPRSQEETIAYNDALSFQFTAEDHETFGDCGLPLQSVQLQANFLPRKLGGDIDGDGAIDEIAQVLRDSDGKRGLALCRAGTWLDLIGHDSETIGEDLEPGYIDQLEAWQWIGPGGEIPQHIQGYDLPQADGDILVLERIEKEAILLYWLGGTLASKHLYHHVEP